ncbi:MAG: hypothetical protein HYR73_05560 [Candidatus Eisenbacteria bacterium]|nr:hypothetical protein [Candidatus Eisenbacteria bacterium]
MKSRRSLAGAQYPSPRAAPARSVVSDPLFPPLGELFDWRGPFLVPALVLLIARVAYAYFLPTAAEDAFITFRYARHLASGHGLVFNPGERVMGFTSPLWAIWMALGFASHVNAVLWSRVASILADFVTLLVVVGLLRRSVSDAAARCFGAFFAAWPCFPAIATSGLECSAMLMLLALASALVARGSAGAIPALALLAVSRPEGLAAAALLALFARRRHALLAAGLTALLLTPLALYFGTIVPQSVHAKSQVYGMPGPAGGVIWWTWLLPRPFDRVSKPIEPLYLVTLAIIFTPAAIAGAIRLGRERRGALALFVIAALGMWAGYSLIGVAYFYWYLLAPLAGLSVLAAIGLPSLVKSRLLYASIAVFVALACVDGVPAYFARANVEFFGFGGAARYLYEHARPGEKAMLEPIGIIGFSCPLVIVDEVGLVSPQVAKRRLGGPGWYADIVASERPDWLVTRASLLSKGEPLAGAGAPFRDAVERTAVLDRYVVVDTVEASRVYAALVILRRR